MGILYAQSIRINDHIEIRVPSVREMLDHEAAYYAAVYSIISTPYEMMVQLDDAGIDFTKINDFYLFCLLFKNLQEMDTSLIFGDLNLRDFDHAINNQTQEAVLYNPKTDVTIDRGIHRRICQELRKVLHIPYERKRPGNEEAKRYLLERERAKLKRSKNKKRDNESHIEPYIVSLVNSPEFKYDYTSVLDISVYQLFCSLEQIMRRVRYDSQMVGLYMGTVKFDKLKDEEKTWICSKLT